jgi:hypothetical protein
MGVGWETGTVGALWVNAEHPTLASDAAESSLEATTKVARSEVDRFYRDSPEQDRSYTSLAGVFEISPEQSSGMLK